MDKYKSKIESEGMNLIAEGLQKLKSKEEIYRFFEDIFTINEIKSIEQRILVAKMLKEKKIYTDIEITTGASSATISRVNRCLNYGSDGYNIILERLKEETASK
jgi:TrpR-related protein YerC/YecD